MGDESDPVNESEIVIRRIHMVYYKSDLEIPIQPEAFRPTERDTDGISLFRERFASPMEVLAAIPGDKQNRYYLAQLKVRDLTTLNLTVVPRPIVGLRGHAVIPALNSQAYEQDKSRLKLVQIELAKLASQDIVHRPLARM